MPTPNVNIENGAVTGTLTHGQQFYWYNPSNVAAIVSNCGNYCVVDAYEVPPNGYTVATLLGTPNQAGLAFSSTAANVGGMPHIQNPIQFPGIRPGEGEKVA